MHLTPNFQVHLTIKYFLPLAVAIGSCNHEKPTTLGQVSPMRSFGNLTIGDISLPRGYKRIGLDNNSFGGWLRTVRLKPDSRIYLYNGRLRDNQSTQVAVLDMPVGDKDLQQCADAILRLRAEYFFSQNEFDSIHFKATDGSTLSFGRWLNGERYRLVHNRLSSYRSVARGDMRSQLEESLEVVFSYCGTISLGKETHPVPDPHDLQIGDIIVKSGPPGHAVLLVDVAINGEHEKIFMLAQGFMPAQSIHIVGNPLSSSLGPWYKPDEGAKIVTPQWIFFKNQLATW